MKKKIVFLLLGAALLIGCSNDPQKKAESSVVHFLKKNVQRYEPVSFGRVDTLDLEHEPAYLAAKDSLRFYKDALKETGDQFQLAASQQGAKRQQGIIADMENFYQGKRYRINHRYKANTAEGRQEEIDKDFYLTATYQVVE